jgi:SAM-dependent methyltransferase
MSSRREAPPREPSEAAVWQEVEFGSYEADLPLWTELASDAGGPVLELGAGAGRVSLHLADAGAEVIALERDPGLCAELRRRADDRGVGVEVVEADLSCPADLRLSVEPKLVIAPLHVLQTLEAIARLALLGSLRDLISSGALLAAALVDESSLLGAGVAAQILPDMREVDGWVYSSEPLWVQVGEERLKVRRIRELVAPDGEIQRQVHDELLHRLSPERFVLEAQETGFAGAGSRPIRAGTDEADSVVAVVEAA